MITATALAPRPLHLHPHQAMLYFEAVSVHGQVGNLNASHVAHHCERLATSSLPVSASLAHGPRASDPQE